MTWGTICDPMFSLRVCMTLAHSIWQVALLAALAWGLDRFGRRRSVESSYALHVAALLAGLAAMPVTYAIVDGGVPGAAAQTGTVVAGLPAGPPVALTLESPRPVIGQGEQTPKADGLSTGPDEAAQAPFTPPAEEPSARWLQVAPWIAALYAAGVLFMLFRLIRGMWHARRLSSGAQLIGDGPLLERLNRLAQKWSMRIVPLLARAEGIVVPKLVGLVRPTILLPVSAITCLSIDELEMILAHELAHVRRFDTWVNLAQRMAEVVLFFNPALWYLSRRTSALREYCCDELTCRAISGSDGKLRTRYASALLRIVELARPALDSRLSTLDHPIALAAAGRSPSDLRRRVARLFGEPIPEPVRLCRGGVILILALTAALFVSMAVVQQTRLAGGGEVKTSNEGHQEGVVESSKIRSLAQQEDSHSAKDVENQLAIDVTILGIDGKPIDQYSTVTIWERVKAASAIGPRDYTSTDPRDGAIWRRVCGSISGESGPTRNGKDRFLTGGTLRPDAYRVTAFVGSREEKMLGMAVSEPVRLDGSRKTTRVTLAIQDGPSVTFTVLDADTNRPIHYPRLGIRLRRPDGLDVQRDPLNPNLVPGDDGRYRIEHLAPGHYQMGVSARTASYGYPDYQLAKPIPIDIRVGEPNDFVVKVAAQPLDDVEARKRWPWAVEGVVTDEGGRPLQGVEIRAARGIGTLFNTMPVISDSQGLYLLRFGPGMLMKDEKTGKWGAGVQVAIISARKPGHAEKNLGRQGDVLMADAMPEEGSTWSREKIILPGKPRRVDFIMVPAAAIQGQHVDESGKRFELQVIGPDGKPVPNASIEIRTEPKPTAQHIQQGQFLKIGSYGTLVKTDANGRLVVGLPEKPDRFSVFIDEPGFGPYFAQWGSHIHAAIPSQFTAELEAGWTVGSVIVNSNGVPIEGAKIRPSIEYKRRPGDFGQLGVGTQLTTDARGRWTFASVPVSMKEVFVEINHPDYKPNRRPLTRGQFGIEPGGEPKARITLQQGLAVTGSVRDESGKPIAGATVRTKFLNDLREAITGPDGAYRLVGCELGMARIVVSAAGKARDFQEVRVEPDMKPVDFVMKPGGTIRIRVLDDQGNPVAKTRVLFQRWRGPMPIQYFEFGGVNQYADDKGVWEWNEAPLDEIRADICPPGGMQLLKQPLIARQQEYVFRVPPPLVISGDVTDAATGQSVKRFRVVPGIRSAEPRANTLSWVRNESFEAVDGQYQLRPDRGERAHLIRIEADGYEVAVSRDIRSDEGKVRVDFKLKPAADIAGTIVTPGGEPAAGAKIALGIAGSQINVKNGDIDDGGTYAARRDADQAGRFRFPSQGADFQLVITHPSGFAYLKSTDGPVPDTVRLTPWARVEGTFRVGKRTVPNVGITLNPNAVHSYGPDVPNIFTHQDVTTGGDGRFVFERVFPGDGRIGRRILLMVNEGATEVTSSETVAARFVPGETTQLDLGGTGRPVTGRLATPAGFQGRVLWNFALVDVQVDLPPPKLPPVPAEHEMYNKLRAASPHFTASVGRDGSFRIDDMPPGDYVLSVRFSQHQAGRLSGCRFSVPETSSAEASRPVDLGVLTLQRP